MSSQTDRRAPDATRIPFDAMVEVGGAQGPSFEAQALNVSTMGIALRAGYLPAVGQPLTCQFETETGDAVLAAGEVTWCHDGPDGGEFGLSFSQLDAQSLATLTALLRVSDAAEATDATDQGAPAPRVPVGRVRLHIDGLGAPMRARVRDASTAKVTTTSELGYLTAGKLLELEDAETGDKRPARIQRVEVETNEARVPQLVVTMKYQDAPAGELSEPVAAPRRRDAEAEDEGDDVKHEFAERAKGVASSMGAGLKKLGPALGSVLLRAKTAAGMLAQKRKATSDEAPARRTTAPPPGGALHSSGRKVVRGERERDDEPEAPPTAKLDKRKLGIAGAVGVALILGLVAMRKPHEPAPLAAAPPEPVATVAAVAPAPEPPAPPVAAPAAPAAPPIVAAAQPTGADTSPAFGADEEEASPPGKKGKPKPFSNGPVAHGTVLKLKMDGPIERLQGAPQPTGFTVVLPNRRSLEAASPLAAKDSRIAGIRVANDGGGAELTVTFKDGVPNYLVRAKGDTLEMVLSKEKASTAEAKPAKKGHKPAGRGKGRKGHGKH